MKKSVIIERLNKDKARLELYFAAEEAILSGAQHYQIGSRSLTRADLSEIRKMIDNLTDSIDELESELAGYGRRRAMRGLPRDV